MGWEWGAERVYGVGMAGWGGSMGQEGGSMGMCGAGGGPGRMCGVALGGYGSAAPQIPPTPRQHMEALRRLQAAAEAALRMEEERKEWGETPKWDP